MYFTMIHNQCGHVLPSITPTNHIDMLPTELIQALNDVYFLHVLATDPEKVIPPGKSLLSLMGRYHYPEQSTPDPSTILHDRVEEAVHRAFWNEVPWQLFTP